MFPGSTLSDHCCRYQNIDAVKLIVVLGELGGHDEYSLVSFLARPDHQTLNSFQKTHHWQASPERCACRCGRNSSMPQVITMW